MYEAFFGFRERPFELSSNLRFLYLPEPHREALSNLVYGISSRKGVTVLTGEVGTGKTTLIRAAMAQADANTLCVHITNPRLTRNEFFEYLARGFRLGDDAARTKVAFVSGLEQQVGARLNRGGHSTLIVDEAQSLSDELMEEVRLLTNMETASERLLSIIMVGQPEFAQRLNDYALRHLKQRVALRCTLRPLTLRETAGYIATRIRMAGGVAASVFTRESVQLIHEASTGIPRVISVLCDNALVSGFAANERPVTSKLVQEVCRDFDITCRQTALPDQVPSQPEETPSATPEAPDAGAMELSTMAPGQAPAAAAPSTERRRRLGLF